MKYDREGGSDLSVAPTSLLSAASGRSCMPPELEISPTGWGPAAPNLRLDRMSRAVDGKHVDMPGVHVNPVAVRMFGQKEGEGRHRLAGAFTDYPLDRRHLTFVADKECVGVHSWYPGPLLRPLDLAKCLTSHMASTQFVAETRDRPGSPWRRIAGSAAPGRCQPTPEVDQPVRSESPVPAEHGPVSADGSETPQAQA